MTPTNLDEAVLAVLGTWEDVLACVDDHDVSGCTDALARLNEAMGTMARFLASSAQPEPHVKQAEPHVESCCHPRRIPCPLLAAYPSLSFAFAGEGRGCELCIDCSTHISTPAALPCHGEPRSDGTVTFVGAVFPGKRRG